MSTYWDDIDEHEEKKHKRLMQYIKKEHEYKMSELDREVKLFKLKKELDKK